MAQLTRKSIVEYLDNCVIGNPFCFFMDLGHGYFYTANSRLSLFGDGEDWAIVFEKSGYSNRGMRIELELNYFGSTLRNLESAGLDGRFLCNAKYIELVSGKDLEDIEVDYEAVSPAATQIKLRGGYVVLPSSVEGYRKWFADWADDSDEPIQFAELGRYLAFEYEGLCRATMDELRTCLPEGLAFLMHIDAWHHRYYYFYENGPDRAILGDKPSSYETFPMIADVLVSGDTSRYRPTLPPTNHWSNWPDAGGL
jgi:hypothetical protein